MRKKVVELCKSLLIALLALSILALTVLALPTRTLTQTPWLAAILSPFAQVLGMERASAPLAQADETSAPAAQPVQLSIMTGGGRATLAYDFTALDEGYEALGGLLAQALDTADAPQQATRARLYEALGGESVAFVYPGALPADAVASWLGADAETFAGCNAWLYVLSARGETAQLYLLGEAALVADTQLASETITHAAGAYHPDGSQFLFETVSELYAHLDGAALIPAAPALRAAELTNPCDSRFITALASRLGFNPYGDATYTDDAGNTFFSETNYTLQISADGRLRLRSQDRARLPASGGAAGQIQAARELLGQLLSGVQSDARLYLTGYTPTDTGAVCTFDYVLSGARVLQASGAGASVTISSGRITAADAVLAGYTLTDGTLTLLPAAQAAVLLADDTRMELCYAVSGGQLSAGWIGRS